jgi:hypothetical protein
MSKVNVSKQSMNALIIFAGAGLLIYDFVVNPAEVYFKIAGLVILMFGLYKSTQQWSSDNNSEDQEEEDAQDDIFKQNEK